MRQKHAETNVFVSCENYVWWCKIIILEIDYLSQGMLGPRTELN